MEFNKCHRFETPNSNYYSLLLSYLGIEKLLEVELALELVPERGVIIIFILLVTNNINSTLTTI